MWGQIIGAGIGAIGKLFGGSSDRKAAAKAQKQQMAWDRHVLQNQIQWRVEDAKKAGIHPLAALGAQIAPASPLPGVPGGGDAIADGVGAIGDAIARALSKDVKLEQRRKEAEIRHLEANTMLAMARSRSEIAAARRVAQSLDSGKEENNMLKMDPFKGVKKEHRLMKTPADAVERDYGDIVSGIYGLLRFMDRWREEPKVYKWSDGKYRTRPEPKGSK